MNPEHLNEESLVRAAYGLAGDGESRHLAECGQCAAAVAALSGRRMTRTVASAVDELPETFWQRQRQEIVTRALHPPRRMRAAALAFSLSLLLALAALLILPVSLRTPAPPARAADDQFLYELYGTLNRTEVRAISPVSMLLDSRQPAKEGRQR